MNTGRLSLDYDERRLSPEQVVKLINNKTSFTASVESAGPAGAAAESTAEVVIKVEGMTDQQAASKVTSALLLNGIVDGSTDVQASTLTVEYDTAKLNTQRIVDAVQQAWPNQVSLVSQSGGQGGGSLLTSAWFILGLVGTVVVSVLAGPWVKRRLTPASDSKAQAHRGSGRQKRH